MTISATIVMILVMTFRIPGGFQGAIFTLIISRESPADTFLAEVAAKFGEVRIVAPDVERSSAGQSITAQRPLSYKRTPMKDIDAFRVNGTPSDCVALGAHNWEKVDVVLSGINTWFIPDVIKPDHSFFERYPGHRFCGLDSLAIEAAKERERLSDRELF